MNKDYFVYIMANENKTIYIWVTNNLEKRVFEHKNWIFEWFTKKYKCHKLVYFDSFSNVEEAILVEKKLKNWKRDWKIDLIEKDNLNWLDLSDKWNKE